MSLARRTLLTSAAASTMLFMTAACGSDDQPDSSNSNSGDNAFPVTIDHKYGKTTIPAAPQRVVSVGFRDQDFLLALDVKPVGIRDWYGKQPYAVWPWAQDKLGDAKPEVLPSAEINFEAVAKLAPDLIVGITSGMSDQDYANLAKIAPTLAQPGKYADFGTPWQETTTIIGQAVGKPSLATKIVSDVDKKYAEAKDKYPEFDGASVAVALVMEGKPGAYNSQQSRSRILADLGMVTPKKFDELSKDEFYFTVSQEELDVIESDVIVWINPNDAYIDGIRGLKLRPQLKAYREGREVLLTQELSGAFAFASPLSIGYVLEKLVPDLVLAIDGDPKTKVSAADQLYTAA